METNKIKIGDLVIIENLKNRWGIACAATVISIDGDFCDAEVWSLNGPGANQVVTKIPINEVELSESE